MELQVSIENDNTPFILSGESKVINGTIARNAGRTTVLKKYTVLARVASTGFYTPFVATNLTTGASVPRAIYLGDDITAAALVAGDVIDLPILVGDAVVDGDQVVFDGGTLSAATVVNPTTIEARRADDTLASEAGIFIESTEMISDFEN